MIGNGGQDACEVIDAAIDELSGVEEGVVAILRRAVYALVNAQEENRRLRREVAQAHVGWYTERQLAERMGVSKDTLARLRKQKKIPCVVITPTVIRYSTLQEAQIAEMLEQSAGGSGQLSVVRRKQA